MASFVDIDINLYWVSLRADVDLRLSMQHEHVSMIDSDSERIFTLVTSFMFLRAHLCCKPAL